MSTTFHMECHTCDVHGPRVHRNAGGSVGLWPTMGGDIFDERGAQLEWNAFLIEHEWCDKRLEWG